METTYRTFFESLTEEEKDQPLKVDLSLFEEGVQNGRLLRTDKDMFFYPTLENETWNEELNQPNLTKIRVPKGTVLITI